MAVVVNMRLVLVLLPEVLVRRVVMVQRRVVVLVRMRRHQVLHLHAGPMTRVVGHVEVLVGMRHSLMGVHLRLSHRHLSYLPRRDAGLHF
jgi:hypothetical protein